MYFWHEKVPLDAGTCKAATLKWWIIWIVYYSTTSSSSGSSGSSGSCRSCWPFNRQAFCVQQSCISSASKMMPYFLPGHLLCQKDMSISRTTCTCTHAPHIVATKIARDKSVMEPTVPAGSRLVKHIAAHSLLSLLYTSALLLMTPSKNHWRFIMLKERVHQKLALYPWILQNCDCCVVPHNPAWSFMDATQWRLQQPCTPTCTSNRGMTPESYCSLI